MRVLVCGAAPRVRTGDPGWTDRLAIQRELVKLGRGTTVIEGEAKGADTLARLVAESLGWPVERFPAEWDRFGKGAGPIRNRQMLVEGKPDLVLAFHSNISRSTGTAHMVKIAREAGIPVKVITGEEVGYATVPNQP